jgi:hypothetical protein
MTRGVLLVTALLLLRPSDPGEGIYETSKEMGKVVDEGLSIVEWAKREPVLGIPTLLGPIALFSGAFGRSRKERKLHDWNT